MIFEDKEWLDRSDPDFDLATSPEIDAENLNLYDSNIHTLHGAIDNLSTAYGNMETTVPQDILVTSSDLALTVELDSTDTNIFTFNGTNGTITFLKEGTFNFRTRTQYSSNTVNTILVTTEIVDVALSTIWQSDTLAISLGVGHTRTFTNNKPLVFVQSDLPKTLKVVFRADGTGMTIANSDYTLNTLTSGASASDHSGLTGRSDTDCHPISAITDLDTVLVGSGLLGEAI